MDTHEEVVDQDKDGFDQEADCDDQNSEIHPNATEVCDEVDNDCDGATDEELLTTFYADTDSDGYGDAESATQACTTSDGWVANATDCDDGNPLAYPEAEETCRDEADLNCDGETNYVPWPTTCEVHHVLSGQLSSADLTGTGLTVGSVTVNGWALKAPKGKTIDQFVAYTEADITAEFKKWLKEKPWITPGMIVVLDLEHPVHLWLLHEHLDADDKPTEKFKNLILGLKRRIDVVRKELPNNPIALYGTVVPHSLGLHASFKEERVGYAVAGDLGLYDDLDYLVPVLYHKFGPTDPAFMKRLKDRTNQALTESVLLKRTDGSSIPLFPFLSLEVFNGTTSNHGDEAPLAEHVDIVISIVLEYPEVALFGFWQDGTDPVKNLQEYFEDVTLLPIPNCSCPE